MKHRVVSLFLALILLVSLLVMPASAASAKDVHSYLTQFAKQSGSYDEDEQGWYSGFQIASSSVARVYFVVYYMKNTQYVHCSAVYLAQSSNNLSFEVTWKISSNPSPAYNAYVELYDGSGSANDTRGTVSLPANYSGGDYSAFSKFSGESNYKSAMLEVLNYYLPIVVEYTRAVINDKNYTLADLGMTGYKRCQYVHALDGGVVTKAPTCGSAGTRTYTCRACGQKLEEEIAPTENHVWDEGSVYLEPGCLYDGSYQYKCKVCGAHYGVPIPALGHDYHLDEGRTTQPSCTEDGYTWTTCSRCGDKKFQRQPALGHAWSYTETLSPGEGKEHGTALYTCTRCQETKEGRLCAAEVFTDMPADDNWAHTPIDWAYFGGVTSGKTATTFAPKATVTRAEVVSFLYKAMGSPEPAGTENPFTDVAEGKYYYKPVLWAVGAGVTTGATPTSFAPKKNCTRAQIVTFLWNAAGKPEPAAEENPFTDVSEGKYYYKAVLWASQNGVTGGVTATTFGPGKACTRAQTVTFLYKAQALLTAKPSTLLDWRWDLYEGEEMDRLDLYPESADTLRVYVEGDEAPVLTTDNPEMLELVEQGRNEGLEEQGGGEKIYEWQVRVIGRGVATISCSLGGTELRSLVIDNSDDTPDFISAQWLVGEESSTENPFTLSAEEPGQLFVVMNYPTLPEGEAAADPDSYELPEIDCDKPELVEIKRSDNPVSLLDGHLRGFVWLVAPKGSGSAQLRIRFRDETVKTLDIVIP